MSSLSLTDFDPKRRRRHLFRKAAIVGQKRSSYGSSIVASSTLILTMFTFY